MGFVIDPDTADEWVANDPRNKDVVWPYLNGEDLNSRPDTSASRWIIDFNDRDETAARIYSLPWTHVDGSVRPERQRRKEDGSFVLRSPLPTRWWQYGDKRPALRRAIADKEAVCVIALTSKSVMPLRVTRQQIFSHSLGVFATEDFADLALLSSTPHQTWAIKYGSGMRNDPRYTPSDVFETLPRPANTQRMREVGEDLHRKRGETMLRRGLGLTALYNLVNSPAISGDPDVDLIRSIHVQIDEAVTNAYGWSDISLGHGFHTYRQMQRWTVSPTARSEILDRLLEENHRRAKLEAEGAPATNSKRGKSFEESAAPEGAMF